MCPNLKIQRRIYHVHYAFYPQSIHWSEKTSLATTRVILQKATMAQHNVASTQHLQLSGPSGTTAIDTFHGEIL